MVNFLLAVLKGTIKLAQLSSLKSKLTQLTKLKINNKNSNTRRKVQKEDCGCLMMGTNGVVLKLTD